MKNKKRKMASKMQNSIERSLKGGKGKAGLLLNHYGGIFNSNAWLNRKQAIMNRVAKKVERIKIRKAERAQALKEGKPVVYSIK